MIATPANSAAADQPVEPFFLDRRSPRISTEPIAEADVIPIASGVRVWIATSHTDMKKGMPGWR